MALGQGDRRGGQGPFPAAGEVVLAEAVATLGDYGVSEVFKAGSAGDFLLRVGEQVTSSLGWVSGSAAAMAFVARRTEGLFHYPGLHTLSIVSPEWKALALATPTSLYK